MWIRNRLNRAILVVTIWIVLLFLLTSTILAIVIIDRSDILKFIHSSTVKQDQIIQLQKENQALLKKTKAQDRAFATQGEESAIVAFWVVGADQQIAARLGIVLPPLPKLP